MWDEGNYPSRIIEAKYQTPLTFLVSKEDTAFRELSAKFHQLEMEAKSAKGL